MYPLAHGTLTECRRNADRITSEYACSSICSTASRSATIAASTANGRTATKISFAITKSGRCAPKLMQGRALAWRGRGDNCSADDECRDLRKGPAAYGHSGDIGGAQPSMPARPALPSRPQQAWRMSSVTSALGFFHSLPKRSTLRGDHGRALSIVRVGTLGHTSCAPHRRQFSSARGTSRKRRRLHRRGFEVR